MKEIKEYELAIQNKVPSLSNIGINATMFWAYRTSKESGNELIDFNDIIYDRDVKSIVETCKKNNIKEFTISSGYAGLVKTLAEFNECNCCVDSIVNVNSPYKNFITNKYELIPAIKMVVR